MAYIGKEPIVGNFQKCDAITVVNGQAAYTLQVSSTNVVPESANHMLVSLNGILQAPVTSFTVSGATLTFVSNLATGDVIDFVILLGNVLDLGTPSDGTVTNAKLAQDIISGETALASAPAATDEFLVSDAGVLKRIDYSLISGKFESSLLHIVHEESDGTYGGATTADSWQTGTINTIKTNEISATLGSNVIALGAGDYFAQCDVFITNSNNTQIRLRDTTNNTTLIVGTNGYAEGYASATNFANGKFTLSGSVNVELQYYTNTTYSNNGQGFAAPASGEVNRFKNLQIWKL